MYRKKFQLKVFITAVFLGIMPHFLMSQLIVKNNIVDQPDSIYEKDMEEIWQRFLKNDTCFLVIHISNEARKKTHILAMYHLINAYRGLYTDDEYLMIESYRKADELYENCSGDIRENLNLNRFLEKKIKIFGRILDREYKKEVALANQAIKEKIENNKIRYRNNMLEKEFEEIETEARKNLPKYPGYCFSSSLDYEILDLENGLEFTLTTSFCDEGFIKGPGLGLAQIGITSYYENLSHWLYEELILNWCSADDLDIRKCLNNISITLEGHTDGWLFDGVKSYSDGAFHIPAGLKFNSVNVEGIEEEITLENDLIDKIRNNRNLGLVRTHIALPAFRKLTNSKIKIKSIEHSVRGIDNRKLIVKIKAPNLFDRNLDYIREGHIKVAKLKTKMIANLMKK